MSFLNRLRRWILVRILVEAIAIIATVAISSRLLSLAIPTEPGALHSSLTLLRNLIVAGLVLGAYVLIIRWMERRRAMELDLRPGAVHFLVGGVLGIALMATVYGILWAAGAAVFGSGDGLTHLAGALVATFLAAVFEELLFRAVLFRILEQAFGTSVALVGSALLFGFAHGMNPGATLISDVAIVVEAGLLLGAAYALTRNLWLAIGIHAGWNFTEGSVFGVSVSGQPATASLFHSMLKGPDLLTGGAFGPEASLIAVAVCGMAALVLGLLVYRRGGWLPPAFRLTADGSR
jgi:membrane protease YdiL (CAAX protease family)